MSPARLVGKAIGGRYLVTRIIGEGGMGTVYEAEHVPNGRVVAVKLLHPRQATKKGAVRRFRQEARAAAAIGHPNICGVYDFGTHDDGSPYLVMEKLVGETLADRIGVEGALPFAEVLETLCQVLSGLMAAHEKGIVHRDIKPENVFLARRPGGPPIVKLLDFGISKMILPPQEGTFEEEDITLAGVVMGTPYYLSPEQARGDRDLDGRADLYACGVILYEALTGRRPFNAPNYNTLLVQILSATPHRARDLRPALPPGFEPILDRAMARDRDGRYRTALEFLRDLKALRAHPGTLARDVGPCIAKTPAVPEPPSSSIEIPIVFGSDTGDDLVPGDTVADPTELSNAHEPAPPTERSLDADPTQPILPDAGSPEPS